MIHTRPGTTDALVVHQIFVDEIYKPAMGLRDYALIVDGGANIGAASLYFRKHHPWAIIRAVEPDPATYDVLKKNVGGGTGTYRMAIWSKGAVGSIIDNGTGAWGRSVVESDPLASGAVDLVAINNFLQERPCLVKLDIEGAELECFRNPSWLQHVDVLAVENHSLAAATAMLAAVKADGRKFRWWDVGETSFVEFT